jgi:hypothetical protein
LFPGRLHRLAGGHHAEHFSFGVDHPDRRDPDLLIDAKTTVSVTLSAINRADGVLSSPRDQTIGASTATTLPPPWQASLSRTQP